ncbi:MAG: hypothetical protein QMC77_08335 [Methanocellales archaeon]|nr:hypothetical protein [Methanocellales archaeon]
MTPLNVILDSDSLVKITKVGAKDAIVDNLRILIPPLVKKEVVDDGKDKGYPDAIIVERDIQDKKIEVVNTQKDNITENEIKSLRLKGGEQDIYRLCKQTKFDVVSSDDQKFLELLDVVNVKTLTPCSLIVLLYHLNLLKKKEALEILHRFKWLVSDEEFELSIAEIGGG